MALQAQANMNARAHVSKLENALRGAEERASEAAAEIKRQVRSIFSADLVPPYAHSDIGKVLLVN